MTILKFCFLALIVMISTLYKVTLAGSVPEKGQVQLPKVSVISDRIIIRVNNQKSASAAAQQVSVFSELGVKITETIQIKEGVTSQGGAKEDLTFNVLALDGRKDFKTVLKRLNDLPSILYAEPVYLRFSSALPNDTDFAQLWGLNNIGQEGGLNGV